MSNLLFLDIETTGLNPWYGDKITCICAKVVDSETKKEVDTFKMVQQDEQKLLITFVGWVWLNDVDSLVTKNGKAFDVPFITARSVILGLDINKLGILRQKPHFDLHTLTSKWVSLDDMAALFKCKKKTGNGLNAIRLFKEGRLEELKEYCWNDVLVTEEVYFKYMELK